MFLSILKYNMIKVSDLILEIVKILPSGNIKDMECNCGFVWFKIEDKWYYVSIGECDTKQIIINKHPGLKGDENE